MIQVIDILILTLRNAILPQDEDKAVFSQSKGHAFHPLFGACIYVFFTQTADVIQRQTATIMIGRLEAINMKTNSALLTLLILVKESLLLLMFLQTSIR